MSARYSSDLGVAAKKEFEDNLERIRSSFGLDDQNITDYRRSVQFNLVSQWTAAEKSEFNRNSKVSFEFNQLYGYIRNIIGEQLQNTPSILARPRLIESDTANDMADLVEGMIRYICYRSNAAKVNQTAAKCQFIGGYGAFYVMTDYEDEKSFNQGIWIKQINDPTECYWDPRAREENKEDAEFCGRTYYIDLDSFKELYPQIQNPVSIGNISDMKKGVYSQYEKDGIVIADHWYKEYYFKTLVQMSDGTEMWAEEVEPYLEHFMDRTAAYQMSQLNAEDDMSDQSPAMQMPPQDQQGMEMSETPDVQVQESVQGQEAPDIFGEDSEQAEMPVEVKRRRVRCMRIWYCKMVENAILEKKEWPSTYLPVIYVPGDDFYIEGQRRTKSATRYAVDSQRFLNYTLSTMAESMKQTRKEQWLVSKTNVQSPDIQEMWRRPDQQQGALIYETDENGAKPERVQVGELPQSWIATNQVLQELIQNIVGRHDASMGQNGNEISGTAVQNRMIQSSLGAYTYVDNNLHAWKHLGKVLVDMIPRVYDTERMVNVITRDNQQKVTVINRLKKDNFLGDPQYENEISKEYQFDIEISVGDSTEIQKQQALKTLISIAELPPNPKLDCILDKVAALLNVDNAKEISDRWVDFAMPAPVKAEITGQPMPQQGPNPQQQMMQMEMQQKQAEMQNNLAKIQIEKQRLEFDYKNMMAVAEQKQMQAQLDIMKMKEEAQIAGVKLKDQALRSATSIVKTHQEHMMNNSEHQHRIDNHVVNMTKDLMGNAAQPPAGQREAFSE